MKMLPLSVVTVLYLWQAFEYYRAGDSGDVVVFIGYSLANLGFLWREYV